MKSQEHNAHTHEPTIVIVGGVASGASAATRARRCNEHARIIIYEKDSHVSFANCGLPYYIGGEIPERDSLLVAKPEMFRARFNIDVRTRQEVVAIDRARKRVRVRHVDIGEEHEQPYDRLILATGASPIVPPIDGVRAPNVFTLRNVEDTDRIKAFIERRRPTRAVVVGAGFIGLEMVEQLRGLGIETVLVELMNQVLPPLDAEMAHVVQQSLEPRLVELHLGDGLKAIHVEGDTATGVQLNSGASIDADLVILGIGVRPNTKLAVEAGLEIGAGGAIRVNPYQQTSDPAVYAVGDAAEYMHGVLGETTRVPLAGPANRSGRLAGEHAATGRSAQMAPVLGTAIVRVFDLTAAMTGISVKLAGKLGRDARAVVVAAGHHAGYFPGAQQMLLKLIYEPGSGRVLGAQAVGGEGVDKRIDVIATAIQLGATVRDLAGLDLAYAPPYASAKDPVHMAAFAACNDLDGLTRFAQLDEDLAGAQLADVRTDAEFAAGHLRDATHIELESLRDRLDLLDPRRPTVVICKSGQRAHVAARILSQLDFSDVKVLTGGMLVAVHARPGELEREPIQALAHA